MPLAFKEQEKSSLATAPCSLRPPRHSTEPSCPQINPEDNQGGTSYDGLEGLGYGSPLRNQDQDEPQERQQEQEEAEDEMKEGDNDDHDREPGQRGENRRRLDEIEVSSDSRYSESSDHSHDSSNEDDEDLRPAKRQKLASAPTDNALTPREHSPRRRLRRLHNLPSLLATQLEIGDALPQADLGNLPTPVDDHHHTPRPSRSPSATVESVPVAEYQEWPFQGFLKRTRIGNETTYNLEFQLPYVPEHLHIPVLSEVLGMRSNKETSAEAATSHDTGAHSKMHSAAVRPQIKRVRWAPKEDATILKMREEDGRSWEEIHAALPHRTKDAIQVRYSTKLKK